MYPPSVVCLDEVDQLEEKELLYDLTRIRWENGRIQIIGLSNNPLIFRNLDPRTKSRLYPLREISFTPYTKEQMKEIIEARVEAAFQEGVVDREALDYLAEFTAENKGDVRVARETLIRAGELASNKVDKIVHVTHVKEILNKTRHAKAISVINALSNREKFILRLIPKEGTFYPDLYRLYRSTDGKLRDRMLRNYMDRFSKLKLINMGRREVGSREKLKCKSCSKKFGAQEQITDILDEDFNILDSSYGQIAKPYYTKIWCNECGKVIKKR